MAVREYESMIILRSDLTETELAKVVTKVEGIMTNKDGKILKKDHWGIKKLAYPIEKHSRGNYFVYDYDTLNENISSLEHALKYDESVLRYMTLKLKDKVNIEKRLEELSRKEEKAKQSFEEGAKSKFH